MDDKELLEGKTYVQNDKETSYIKFEKNDKYILEYTTLDNKVISKEGKYIKKSNEYYSSDNISFKIKNECLKEANGISNSKKIIGYSDNAQGIPCNKNYFSSFGDYEFDLDNNYKIIGVGNNY